MTCPRDETGEPMQDEPARGRPVIRGDSRVSRLETLGPWLVVAATVVFGLYELRAQTQVLPYLNDNTLDEQMARFASARIFSGHLPLLSWYPYLGLGSPQFLHYQSLGATIVGVIGRVFGVDRTFAWSTYLLVACWPLCVFISARLFGISRWAAALGALMAPFVASATAVGYEQRSYLWLGYGVWAQMCAMWTLPLAWGCTWRALESRRYLLPATLLISLTIALHFMTGYLALGALILMPLVSRRGLQTRFERAGLMVIGVSLTSAVVIEPLVRFSSWASINEFLQGTPSADSYGAKRVVSWLVTGHLFDEARLPVITILVACGLVSCLIKMRNVLLARALVGLFVASLVVFFGRRTFGSVMDILPGNQDLFLRRFLEGVQLSGIFLAGIGAVSAEEFIGRAIRRMVPTRFLDLSLQRSSVVTRTALVVLGLLYLAPAWTQIASLDQLDHSVISLQAGVMSTEGAQVDALIGRLSALGPGRVYAGMTTNWGMTFTVGEVPVLKYLAWRNVDEVGFTLRTASLMTDPEAYFNETNPGDYALFGVRYLIFPFGRPPLVQAHLVARAGNYVLWEIPSVHLIEMVDTIGTLTEGRAALGRQSAWLLDSNLASSSQYLSVAFNGMRASAPTVLAGADPTGPPGSVLSQREDLAQGISQTVVDARRRAVVLLKVSFDPGWTATVDGHPSAVEMIAPALVGVVVTPGRHTVYFRYRAYSGYPLLFGLGAFGFMLMTTLSFGTSRLWRRRGGSARPPM